MIHRSWTIRTKHADEMIGLFGNCPGEKCMEMSVDYIQALDVCILVAVYRNLVYKLEE